MGNWFKTAFDRPRKELWIGHGSKKYWLACKNEEGLGGWRDILPTDVTCRKNVTWRRYLEIRHISRRKLPELKEDTRYKYTEWGEILDFSFIDIYDRINPRTDYRYSCLYKEW
jgi:phosphodiesterase/alkaline phosphatase D-like protein